MATMLSTICALPIAGFLVLSLGGRRLADRVVAVVGVGSVLLAAVGTALIGYEFLSHVDRAAQTATLWTWLRIGDFAPTFALRLDALSLTMLGVITGVGFLIHL